MAQRALNGQPLVSVGIPTYNRPEGLRRTLECITSQSYRNLQIIVSDNCSPSEEPAKVARDFASRDERITFVRQQRPGNVTENFCFVLRQATGDYFMWAADDDEWDRTFVEKCVQELSNEAVVTAMTRFRTHFRQDHRTRKKLDIAMPGLSPRLSLAQNILAFFARPTPSILYGLHRREALRFFLEEDNWFDFYDCYFVLRLLAQGKIAIVDEPLYAAGVDTHAYQVKSVAASGWPRLSYLPFMQAATELLGTIPMSLPERLVIRFRLALMVLTWFVGHEVLRVRLS